MGFCSTKQLFDTTRKMAELWICLFFNTISSSECNCEYSHLQELNCFFDGCVNRQCHLLTISYTPETLLVVVGALDTHSCLILVTHQAPLSIGFSRQEYWSELPFPSPGVPPNPGIEPGSPALHADSLLTEPPESPRNFTIICLILTTSLQDWWQFSHLIEGMTHIK